LEREELNIVPQYFLLSVQQLETNREPIEID